MDLRLLNSFTTVVAVGTVSKAAAELMITQPALTRQIQQLERQLGFELFVRHKGRLELSAAGLKFVDAARTVLASAEAARSVADSLAAGRLARVRMAAPTTTLTDVLAPFLAELLTDDPLITVEEATYATAVTGLRSGVDLAVFTAPPPRFLHSRRVAVLPIWAYVHPGHPMASSGRVSVPELAAHRLIVLEGTARARQLLDESLVQHGVAAADLIECRNPQVAQALAAARRGVAVLSDDARFGLTGLPISTPQGALTLTLHAGWDPQHHAAGTLDDLARRLRAFCATRYGCQGDAPFAS
ncbi:LysR family transcriptional regulator [Nocardioides astragali]|uniref:LysR family transcriptional regulator n=1 Tax=Nocardioides astragali TaxID=1776736 RepID=A0ABW2NBJ5_9ACTN|nr:LysR family transcriptional regulator [Nocardioides astragali]